MPPPSDQYGTNGSRESRDTQKTATRGCQLGHVQRSRACRRTYWDVNGSLTSMSRILMECTFSSTHAGVIAVRTEPAAREACRHETSLRAFSCCRVHDPDMCVCVCAIVCASIESGWGVCQRVRAKMASYSIPCVCNRTRVGSPSMANRVSAALGACWLPVSTSVCGQPSLSRTHTCMCANSPHSTAEGGAQWCQAKIRQAQVVHVMRVDHGKAGKGGHLDGSSANDGECHGVTRSRESSKVRAAHTHRHTVTTQKGTCDNFQVSHL
jgi:hypothetical protein